MTKKNRPLLSSFVIFRRLHEKTPPREAGEFAVSYQNVKNFAPSMSRENSAFSTLTQE